MNIKRRQFVSLNDQALHARQVLEQSLQRLWTTQEHTAALFLDQGRVTCELNGVAETLLALQQNRAALQRFSVPELLAVRTRFRALASPAPLVLGPAAFVIAHLQQGQGAVPVGRSRVGLKTQSLVVAGHGLFQLPLFLVGAA